MVQRIRLLPKEKRINLGGLQIIYGVENNKKNKVLQDKYSSSEVFSYEGNQGFHSCCEV